MITVKSNVTNRIALWQKHPEHPGGEVFVAGDIVAEVAETDEVLVRLANGFIAETADAPTQPLDDYDNMSEEAILSAIADFGETGVIVVRQYEALHENRPAIMGFVAERSVGPASTSTPNGAFLSDVFADAVQDDPAELAPIVIDTPAGVEEL